MTSDMIATRLIKLQHGYAAVINHYAVWRRGQLFQVEGYENLLTFEETLSVLDH